MIELLRQVIPYLGAATGALVLLVLVREAVRSLKRRRWRKQKERCLSLVGRMEHLTPEEVLGLATELKKNFPLEMIEAVLDESLGEGANQKLATVYDQLGIIENHLTNLREDESWPERANAAEKLGKIGHGRAVLPLIALLRDADEDREVKSAAMRALGKIHDTRAMEPLIDALGLPDPAAGQPLADVLMQFGELAVPPLTEILSSSRREMQRYWAARILGRSKTHSATSALLNALSDHSAKVRAEACLALGASRIREAVAPLTRIIMEDPVSLVREAAAEGLGNIADDRALTALKESLADFDDAARRKAMEALEKMGERASPFFIEALQEESSEAQAQAATALERMGVVAHWIEELGTEEWGPAFDRLCRVAKAGVVETLARSLTNPQLPVRIRLCRILLQGKSHRTFEALTELAQKDTEWVVRLEALVALLKLADQRSSPLVVRALNEEEETVRERLLTSLREAPRQFSENLVETVCSLLEDANVKVRVESVRLLASLHTETIFPFLLSSIEDGAAEVRREVAIALQHYPQEDGVHVLIEALNDPDRDVRIVSVRSLGHLRAPQAIGPLAQMFEKADEGYRDDIAAALAAMPTSEFYQFTDLLMGLSHPKARAGVAWTLGLIGDQKGIQLLTTFLKDPEPEVRASAAGAVGRFGRKEIVPALLKCLADPNERVRAAVVNALGQSGDVTTIEHLLPMLKNEPDAFVCQRVVLAMGCLGSSCVVRRASCADDKEKDNIKGAQRIAHYAERIKKWLETATDLQCQTAGLVALALLRDESSFQKILRGTQEPKLRPLLQGFLKDLPSSAQDRFFSFLSLDPQLFWHRQDEKAEEHYRQLLQSSREAEDRVRAIRALSTLGGQSAIPAIELAFAKDPSPMVRAAALAALGLILQGGELVAKIAQAALDPSDAVRVQVVPMIERLSPKELQGAREQLIPLLDSTQEGIRKPVAELLARLYTQDWHILADRLLGAEKQSRILGLVETLGNIGDSKIAPLFVQFMKHHVSEVRSAAAFAAAESGILSRQEWIPYLEDPLESVRLAAMRGLGKQLDGEVLEIFAEHLEDPSTRIRREMASLLGKRKLAGDKRPEEILRRLSQDENFGVRLVSFLSLFRLGVTGLAKKVGSLLPNFEVKERETVLGYLEKEGVFVELIGTLRQARQAAARKEVIELIAALDLQHYVQEIAGSLQDPASEVRLAAIEALGQVEDMDVQQAIGALSQDPIEEVRNAVKRRRLKSVK